jgi:hypothetical protein
MRTYAGVEVSKVTIVALVDARRVASASAFRGGGVSRSEGGGAHTRQVIPSSNSFPESRIERRGGTLCNKRPTNPTPPPQVSVYSRYSLY